MTKILAVLASILVSYASSGGDDASAQLKSVSEKLDRLTQMVEGQQKMIAEQQKRLEMQEKQLVSVAAGGATIAKAPGDLLKRVERAEAQSTQAILIGSRKKPSDSSPYIGMAVDTAFRYYDGNAAQTDRPAGNDFSLRGAEIVMYTDVDPNFRSYLVLNAVGDAADNDEAIPAIEEAAIYTTSLKHVQVKGGRFFTPFGRLSPVHEHDLPFTTRPRSIETYVGGESGGDGVQIQALLPISHFLQITGGVFNKIGAEGPLLNAEGDRRNAAELTYMLKALTSFNIGDEHELEVGLSTVQVPDELIRRNLADLELTYRWRPKNRGTLREKLVWGTELLRNEQRTRFLANPDEVDIGDDPIFKRESRSGYGGYSYVEYFLDRRWSFGPRIDVFQNTDPSQENRRTFDQTYTAFLTYKFSEFSRLRFEANRHEYFDGNSANELFLQWTAFWGAHTHNFDQR